jgi:diguanylate cyclase (GGDEF)-like protein/putative nucleotidyltransferase with HDIG domain
MASISGDDVPMASLRNSNFELRLMARVLAGLYAAGATLAGATVLLPHTADANEVGLVAIVGIAYVVAGLLYTQATKIPDWLLPVSLAWGSILITGVAHFSGESPSPLVFFYLWIFLYSAYFFSTFVAALQIGFVGLAYGSILIADRPEGGFFAWWLVGIGSLLVGALVIGVMRRHVEELILRLHGAARTDPLTMLTNRRGFREQLDLEIERARRSGTAMTVALGDIDHFKHVNDHSGHQVGDIALTRIGQVLLAGKRLTDFVARIGGEEFALIFPDSEGESAQTVAERLREEVRKEFSADPVQLTISFGVAQYPTHGETAGSLLRAVDEALYEAKESGRNRTVLHTDELRGRLGGNEAAKDVEGERFIGVMLAFAEAVDLRFSGSARHSETVGRYAEMMARELGLSEQQVGRVRLAGMLHDIGKSGIPDSILHKAGKLTDHEFTQIKAHPGLGAQILEHACLEDVRAWVGAHHERPDGTGYPLGLIDGEISIESQIIAVADAYEAMTSDRAYRDAIGSDAARAELRRCAGTQFDPRVVEAFLTASHTGSARDDVPPVPV